MESIHLTKNFDTKYGIAINIAIAKRIEKATTKTDSTFVSLSFFFLSSAVVAGSSSKNSDEKRGGRQKLPYVFTEQGVAMLSSVLRSKKAIQTNIQIMNTFVQVRQYVLEHKDLTKRFTELEQYFMQYCKDNETDKQKIYEAIDLLMNRTKPAKIGFKTD